jgi:hypothetical protein
MSSIDSIMEKEFDMAMKGWDNPLALLRSEPNLFKALDKASILYAHGLITGKEYYKLIQDPRRIYDEKRDSLSRTFVDYMRNIYIKILSLVNKNGNTN